MTISNFLSGSRIVLAFWLLVSLGSCSVAHYVDNSSTIYMPALTATSDEDEDHCGEFKRTVRIDHHRPMFPKVDVTKLTLEERVSLLLAYTERLKKYLEAEEQYLNEDMLRHRSTCHP